MLTHIVIIGIAMLDSCVTAGETEATKGTAACSLLTFDKDIDEVAKTGSLQAIMRVWQQFYQCRDGLVQGVDDVFSTLDQHERDGLKLLVEKVREYDADLEQNIFLDLQLTLPVLRKSIQLGCLGYMADAHSTDLESGEEAVAKVGQLLCTSVHKKLRPVISLLSEVMNEDQMMSRVEPDLKSKLVAARVCQRIVQLVVLDAKSTQSKSADSKSAQLTKL